MDPLHASIALGPLAVYFLLLGLINLSAEPFVTSGTRDSASLGIAIMGFVIVGPMELFMPDWTPGWLAWPLMIAFYLLTLTLLVLLQRPRIVIYNATADQLRPVLAETVSQLDKESRVAGESVFMPNLGVQFHLEPLSLTKNVQLRANGIAQSFNGWRDLEKSLRQAVATAPGSANQYAIVLLASSAVMTGLVVYWMFFHGSEVQEKFAEMLRMTSM